MTQQAPPGKRQRPREITAVAVVAFIGSTLGILVGILVASAAALAFYSIQQKYPGVTLHGPNPDLPILKEIVVLATVIPVVWASPASSAHGVGCACGTGQESR